MGRSLLCSPLMKQCFATFGVILNTMEQAVINGFSSVLIPQLRTTKYVELDDETESWIASVHNISLTFGALVVPLIMGRYGRKPTNFISAGILCVTWFSMSVCSGYYSFLIVKIVQGLCSGMIAILAPVVVGEYSSPKYRGAFLTTIAVSYSVGILFVHGLGTVLSWNNVARVFGVITFVNCLIILYSPESPSYLATRGRFDDCRKSFYWLRYSTENEEVEKIIKANMKKMEGKRKVQGYYSVIKGKFNYVIAMFKKKEFYKPLILMFHLHLINEWSGTSMTDAYSTDIYKRIVDSDVNIPMLLISTDSQRLITNCIAVVCIKMFRRRLMLMATVSINIAAYLLIAAYVFARTHYGITFGHSVVGVILIHLHIFSIASGSVPLPNIISGEIFALEYRGLSTTLALVFFSLNMVINTKTALSLFSAVGLHGAYIIYAGFLTYGLVMSWILLPETKDKTLHDIEEIFRGKPIIAETDIEIMEKIVLSPKPDQIIVNCNQYNN